MSNFEIEDYARVVLLQALSHAGWPEGFHRRSDLVEHLHNSIIPRLEEFDPRLSQLTLDSLIERLFAELCASGSISSQSDRFAGEYLVAVPNKIVEFRKNALASSEICTTANSIGFKRFFSDVFAGYRQDPEIERDDLNALPPPPIDNRLITVEPIQLKAVNAPLNTLIADVEADNGLPDDPNFRERILGQLKAGREMLLSGCVRAQLLYWVLLKALGELVERYGKKAIGVAAARLIELLVENVLKS